MLDPTWKGKLPTGTPGLDPSPYTNHFDHLRRKAWQHELANALPLKLAREAHPEKVLNWGTVDHALWVDVVVFVGLFSLKLLNQVPPPVSPYAIFLHRHVAFSLTWAQVEFLGF